MNEGVLSFSAVNSFTINIILPRLAKKLAQDLDLDKRSTEYLYRRVCNEGLPFVTKTLPKLAKTLLKSLEKGYFDRSDLTNFRWKGASLEFCSVWLSKIFDHNGHLLINACPYAIKSIRQLCEYMYKFVTPFSKGDQVRAEHDFLKIEEDVSRLELCPKHVDGVRKVFETMYPRISRATVCDVFAHSRPRFTSGSFAGSQNLRLNASAVKNRPDHEVGTTNDAYHAHTGYFKPYPSSPTSVRVIRERKTSEVVIVPKDSRGPRIISKEPMHLLRGQMSYFDWLSSSLERDSQQRINFSDQSINRKLACKGSTDRSIATLDLEKASDMMSLKLARGVFRYSPAIRWFIENARSTSSILPVSGEEVRLNKLSGMGSGITFPTMALLIQCSIVYSVKQRFPNYRLDDIKKNVYVYGDDIVVPTSWYNCAVAGLTASGFKVNNSKSYRNSHFRESCGGDFYKGVDVGPTRLKLSGNESKIVAKANNPVINVSGPRALVQLEAHCRELVQECMFNTSEFFYELIETSLRYKLPDVSGDSACLGRYQVHFKPTPYKGRKVMVSSQSLKFDGRSCPYKTLNRFFKLSDPDDSSGRHGYYSVPYRIKLKLRNYSYEACL